MNEEELYEMINELDGDGTEAIEWGEFASWMTCVDAQNERASSYKMPYHVIIKDTLDLWFVLY